MLRLGEPVGLDDQTIGAHTRQVHGVRGHLGIVGLGRSLCGFRFGGWFGLGGRFGFGGWFGFGGRFGIRGRFGGCGLGRSLGNRCAAILGIVIAACCCDQSQH